jgi:pepF/M3 family oligoendopeptidase
MTSTAAETLLPTWDMTTIYPAVDSPEYADSVAALAASLPRLEALLTDAEALGHASGPDVTTASEKVLAEAEAIGERAFRNVAYLNGYVTVDSRDRAAQARFSELQILLAQFQKAFTRFTAWLGHIDVDALIESSQAARDHEYLLHQAQVSAQHLMEPGQEDLAAETSLSGGVAWGQLYDDVSSQIMVPFANGEGEIEQVPMAEIRNLAMDPDRDVRRRAYEAELAAWKQWETPIAAALNGVKGEHTTLARRRQWDDVLDEALHQNNIDRATLDAMMSAARDAFPDLRRYFHAKARALGVERLAWYDLFAPLSSADRVWPWEEGLAFLYDQFGSYSDKMRSLAERAVEERWIDVGPRPGKVGGAFCMPVGDGASRVLLNYTPAFDGVSTLAHELGHAYHNLCQAHVTPWRRSATPMTLAETASTFCETILRQAAIASGTEDEALAILEGSLQDAAQIVLDITSRFLFESAVMAKRPERALSPEEFCELMLDAQRQTYGEGLDPDALHSYMWAAKGHYYSPNAAFYNYPYMFGLLFGLGLYARYQEDPDGFRASYDDLLASTGDADAATLARRFGFDTTSPEFWKSSLDVIRGDIDTFEALVERRLGESNVR